MLSYKQRSSPSSIESGKGSPLPKPPRFPKALRSEIRTTIRTSISAYFQNVGKRQRSQHVLDYLFPKERYVRSLIGGLETSLGTTVWEPLARILALKNGFEICRHRIQKPKPFPKEMRSVLTKLKDAREDDSTWISLRECARHLRTAAKKLNRKRLTFVNAPSGKGVDVYLKKRRTEYAFDIKTNQINKRGGADLNNQLLEWYAYKACQNPNLPFHAYIAFPFNPYGRRDWWQATGGREKPLRKGEALVESDFWDLCYGQKNTWLKILQIFKDMRRAKLDKKFRSTLYPRKKKRKVRTKKPKRA